MKRIALFVAVLALSVGLTWAEYYRLSGVKRIDRNLYKSGNLLIETKYCYYYTYGEDAVLRWEGKYGDNAIFWEDNSSCEVKAVYVR